jgi:hypothetical protein
LYWKKRQGQETFSLLRENDYARILPIQFTARYRKRINVGFCERAVVNRVSEVFTVDCSSKFA